MNLIKKGSQGPLTELLQSILKKIGLYSGEIDGIFGLQTEKAVIDFQKQQNLTPDGIVYTKTWSALFYYTSGYIYYKIKPDDTIFNIAKSFNTNANLILTTNPNLNPYNLIPGTFIIVPSENIVFTNISYSYNIMEMNLLSLKRVYPFIQTSSIGKSVLGKNITVVKLGNGTKEVFYSASIHANEWITSVILMKFIEDYAKAYALDSRLFGYRIRDLFNNVSIYIAPMINPDGVNLVTGEFSSSSPEYIFAKKIASNYTDIPFPSGWKANINGVDLKNYQPKLTHTYLLKKISPCSRIF